MGETLPFLVEVPEIVCGVHRGLRSGGGEDSGGGSLRGGRVGFALEHVGPGVAEGVQIFADFDETLVIFLKVRFEEAAVHVLVKGTKGGGERAATFDV